MKKLNVILLIFSFVLSGIGGIFLFDATSSTNNTIQIVAPSNKIESEEITEYKYKTYEDYFIDNFNLPAEAYTKDTETGVVTIDYTKITKKTANGETELSYNGNVFYTITSDDLTGSGSQTAPYVVNSTKGFYYLTNRSLAKLVLNSSYIELNCDVVLNDETFDEKGNANGGDGSVYQWSRIYAAEVTINGKNHTIQGMYINEPTGSNMGLFISNVQKKVENLFFSNVFIHGWFNNSVLGMSTKEVNNVIVKNGTIIGGHGVAGIVSIGYNVSNCINRANIYLEQKEGIYYSNAGGIISSTRENFGKAKIEKCINYGNIKAIQYVGSIVGYFRGGVISDCLNYGKISVSSYGCGGLVGTFSSSENNNMDGVIKNSKNYGLLQTTYKNSESFGGVIGSVTANLIIDNSSNEGMIIGKAGDIIGTIGNTANKISVSIVNSQIKSKYENLIGMKGSSAQNVDFLFRNNRIETITSQLFIFKNMYSGLNITMMNNKIYGNNKTICLVGLISLGESIRLDIQNMLIEGSSFNVVSQSSYINRINMINSQILVLNDLEKHYYGTDFSGFYYSWKLGKIGLVALDGVGQFQGQIDEEWLASRGFEKKQIG